MSKFVYFISILLFLAALYILPCLSHNCIHDDMTVPEPAIFTRSLKYHDVRSERDKDPKYFEPLKIHFYLDISQRTISPNTMYNIKIAVQKITSFIEKTFKVRKKKMPFLLERESCKQRWHVGVNRGKCSEYHGEREECSARGIAYEIPSRFIARIEVYDFSNPKPRFIGYSGPGLQESNFIVFITSENTEFCLEKAASAYSACCRVDHKTHEPLAGIINLCPTYFAKKIYPADHYYNVLLHELFHILGFSSDLFEKFIPCQKGIYCDVPRHVIQEDSDGILRMMFPLVIERTQKHFNCSRNDFGAPMDIPDTKNETDVQFHASHWHPVLMYSSIMTPKFSEYDKIFVDDITLAVFASTGWYQINFTYADQFTFGSGEGCNFGISNSSCKDSVYLCDPSLNGTGCDIENKGFARCTSLAPYHACGVYQPYTTEDCSSEVKKQFGLDFFALGYIQRCFMLQNQDAVEPYCFPVKCKTRRTYSIFVNMTWYTCDYYKESIVVDNTTIYCPETFSPCATSLNIHGSSGRHRTISDRHFCPADTNFFIAVRMYFSVPSFKDLLKNQNFKNFKITALRGITDSIKIPTNYIVNSSLTVFKQVFLDFYICPSADLTPVELTVILMKVQTFLDSGNFLQKLTGPKDAFISSTDIQITPTDVIAFSDHDGFRVLLIFPTVCAIFLIATFIASIIRQFLIQKHRPQRTLGRLTSEIHLSETSFS